MKTPALVLPISTAAHNEIKLKLGYAGFGNQIQESLIDMAGIVLEPETPAQSRESIKYLQALVDAWEQRPRRQLDYSGLSQESLNDIEFTTSVLTALIPAMRDIKNRFGLEPTPPIVIQMPMPTKHTEDTTYPATALTEAPAEGQDSGPEIKTPQIASTSVLPEANPPNQAQAADSPTPSKAALKAPGKGRNTRSPKATRSKAGTVSRTGHKSDTAGTHASADATPPAAPPVEQAAAQSSTTEKASPGADLSDPPPPTLSPIGE